MLTWVVADSLSAAGAETEAFFAIAANGALATIEAAEGEDR